MNLTEDKKKEYSKRILLSRFRILSKNGFFGLLLLHVKFGLDESCDTAYTDGTRINFSPDFLDKLSNQELDFVMMHEIMHIVLKHCFRGTKADKLLFNIACDIVVNSNILQANQMNESTITLKNFGVAMHLTPNNQEGYLFTAEEVYDMLIDHQQKQEKESKSGSNKGGSSNNSDSSNGKDKNKNKSSKSSKGNDILDEKNNFDDHDHWNESEENKEKMDEWEKNVVDAIESVSITAKGTSRGTIPLGASRMVEELKKSTVDWKVLLNDFISFEVNDYSFLPPDKRFEGPFFMPDFNEESPTKKLKLLFFVDTSGSISDDDLTKAYSEIKGAIDEGDTFEGYLSFFDCKIYGVNKFCDEDELLNTKPIGGGGTSFHIIFESLDDIINDIGDDIQAIIILTDGYATFPNEDVRGNIPVLWIINNDDVTPPWGVVARIK